MEMPAWLNLSRIAEISVVLLAVVQYVKDVIPSGAIRYVTLGLGVLISVAAAFYTGEGVSNWVTVIVNGILAAVLADTGYQFLSGKSGSLTLPSKGDSK